jgi:hypothetical protein
MRKNAVLMVEMRNMYKILLRNLKQVYKSAR